MEELLLLTVVLSLTLLTELSRHAEALRFKRSTLSDLEFEVNLLKQGLKAERNARIELEKTVAHLKQGKSRGGDLTANNMEALKNGLLAEKNRNADLESSLTELKGLLLEKFNASVLSNWQKDTRQYCPRTELASVVNEFKKDLLQITKRAQSTDGRFTLLNSRVSTLEKFDPSVLADFRKELNQCGRVGRKLEASVGEIQNQLVKIDKRLQSTDAGSRTVSSKAASLETSSMTTLRVQTTETTPKERLNLDPNLKIFANFFNRRRT